MKRIEIAEDEDSIRTLIQATLEGPECEILQARDGIAALELARREQPDLILLDWMMPGMSGLEVLKALRQDPSTMRIPVIMLTAMGQDRDRKTGIASGALHYMIKPFSPLELLQKVQGVFARTIPPESEHEQRERPATRRRAVNER